MLSTEIDFANNANLSWGMRSYNMSSLSTNTTAVYQRQFRCCKKKRKYLS
jgi:hypothetical protein